MLTTDHPSWPAYKEALARVVDAGIRLERAQAGDLPDLCQAEQEFQAALDAYAAVRLEMAERTSPAYDGVRVPQAWLEQSTGIIGVRSRTDSAEPEQRLGQQGLG